MMSARHGAGCARRGRAGLNCSESRPKWTKINPQPSNGTADAASDAEHKPDAERPTERSAVALNYEEMLAALNGLLAEMREERRQAEASGSFVDVQHGQEPATIQNSVWVEAHAALSQK